MVNSYPGGYLKEHWVAGYKLKMTYRKKSSGEFMMSKSTLSSNILSVETVHKQNLFFFLTFWVFTGQTDEPV